MLLEGEPEGLGTNCRSRPGSPRGLVADWPRVSASGFLALGFPNLTPSPLPPAQGVAADGVGPAESPAWPQRHPQTHHDSCFTVEEPLGVKKLVSPCNGSTAGFVRSRARVLT